MTTKVHITIVVSATGTDHGYVGLHLGLALLNRGLTKEVVTFEADVNDEELGFLQNVSASGVDHDRICRSLASQLAVAVHSIRVSRNINH